MQIVSFYFFIFLFFTVILYYIFPKNRRWIILLISSLIFFLLACSWELIFYLLFGIISTYIGTIYINEKCKTNKQKKIIFFVTILLIISELFITKYINIFSLTGNAFSKIFNINLSFKTISILAPLGISYYTLSLLGYVIDVYRGTSEPQKNILKHALFVCYYPLMISGPIVRYNEMKKEFFDEKKFEWNNIYFGFYRIVYGLMKKLVIANQLAIVVKAIFSDFNVYSGYYIIIGVVLYAIQIYADFSGCMDIIIGASRMYGIILPENFNSPFFSKTLPEFWRRWHISLGQWAKDYIMYPLLKSNFFQKMGIKCKNKFGKKIGKKIPTIFAIFILWLLIGLWHGASYRYIFAAGILPWLYLTFSLMFEDLLEKISIIFHLNKETFSFHLFQSIRTLSFMCLIWLFVCSPSLHESIDVIKSIFIFPIEGLMQTLPSLPNKIMAISLTLFVAVDYLSYKGIDVLKKFRNQGIWFRWLILLMLLVITLIYGVYGPGYNASDFIYGGF